VTVAVEAPAQPRLPLLRPLADRDFRLLWTGSTLSMLADQFSFIALAWLALQLTGSPLALGSVLMTAAIPRAIFMLLGGALSDRLSARYVMAASSSVRAVAMGATAALIFSHDIQLWQLYGFSLAFGLADAFFYPSRGALLPAVIPDDQLEPANALLNGSTALVGVAGAAASGLVVAHFGTGIGFAVDSGCFALVTLAIAAISARSAAPPFGGLLAQIRGGLVYAWRDPALRVMLGTMFVVDTALGGPISVGVAALARERLGGAASLGALFALFAAGTVVGNVLGGSLGRRSRVGLPLAALITAIGAGVAGIALANGLALASAIVFVIGIAAALSQVLFTAWLQRRTSPDMQGRVQSIVMFSSVGLAPATMAAAGAIAQLDVSVLFLLSGGIVVVTGLCASLSRSFRRL
jgi:MFS family permease